jgi:drug/metabolite transporter (DMT)-like permease
MALNKTSIFKGYFLMMVTVLAMANVYIFSKAALNIVDLAQFGVYWFGLAFIYNIALNKKKLTREVFMRTIRVHMRAIFIFSSLELIGTVAFFLAIKTMINPALVSFLANLTPVLVTLLGVFILKERFSGIEITGILLAIGGSFIIAYHPGSEHKAEFNKAILLMLVTSICYSLSTIISKKYIHEVSPAIFTLSRVVFLWVASIVYMVIIGSSPLIESRALIHIVVGSFLGPFLATFSAYSALKYIEASRSSVLSSSKSVFVVLTSWLYFNLLPGEYQILGGILTILGVLLISLGSIIKYRRSTVTKLIH